MTPTTCFPTGSSVASRSVICVFFGCYQLLKLVVIGILKKAQMFENAGPFIEIYVSADKVAGLNIQIAHVKRVFLNEVSAFFNHITHQLGEDLISCICF